MIGILTLQKSYGRHKDKLLYKFIPYEGEPFLVPYSIKSSFSKLNEDLYAVCTLLDKIGVVDQCLGSVNSLEAYYEYELYRKGLVQSLKPFHNRVKDIDFVCEALRGPFIFTIDSATTTDFDDAISVHYEDLVPVISVYIANVPYIMEKYGLWDAFVDKVATIYLPDKKRNMLPHPLENACSLREGEARHVYVMEITGRDVRFSQKCITVSKNYVYEEPALLASRHYRLLLSLVRELASEVSFHMELVDSYGLIVYLMIYMNHQCALKLERGVLRVVRELAPRPEMFVEWMNWFGEYVVIDGEKPAHEMLGVVYAHVTSPIRRLTDIINLAILQGIGGEFCDAWLKRIDFINEKTKSIKKAQNNCELMKRCLEGGEYDAIVSSGNIYIPDLKMLKRTTMEDGEVRVKLVIVANKEAFKKVKLV